VSEPGPVLASPEELLPVFPVEAGLLTTAATVEDVVVNAEVVVADNAVVVVVVDEVGVDVADVVGLVDEAPAVTVQHEVKAWGMPGAAPTSAPEPAAVA
jgi:hypothetical protein